MTDEKSPPRVTWRFFNHAHRWNRYRQPRLPHPIIKSCKWTGTQSLTSSERVPLIFVRYYCTKTRNHRPKPALKVRLTARPRTKTRHATEFCALCFFSRTVVGTKNRGFLEMTFLRFAVCPFWADSWMRVPVPKIQRRSLMWVRSHKSAAS